MPLRETLAKLVEVEGIDGALLAGEDGLLIAGVAPDGSNLDTMAALGTYAMQAARRMSELADRGPAIRVTVEGASNHVAMQPLEDSGTLIVLFNDSINLGYVRFLLGRYTRRLEQTVVSIASEVA